MTDLPTGSPAGQTPAPASPFSPGRGAAPSGCGRIALIGCGLSTLLLGIAAVVFLFKADDLLAWTLRKMETQIAAQLPAELTEEERGRFHGAFTGARGAIERGEIDPAALQRLQVKLAAAGSRTREEPSSREEILDLIAALEAVARGRSAGASPAHGGPPAQ